MKALLIFLLLSSLALAQATISGTATLSGTATISAVAASGPTQIASDDFPYADGTALSATGNWAVSTSATFGVWTNYVYMGTFGSIETAWWTGAGSFTTNQYAQGKVNNFDAAWSQEGPGVRVTSGGGYFAMWTGTNTIKVVKYTLPATNADLNAACGTAVIGDDIQIRATGTSTTTLDVYKNGSSLCTTSDSSSPFTTGVPGIGATGGAAGNNLKNWKAGNL